MGISIFVMFSEKKGVQILCIYPVNNVIDNIQ